MSQQKVTGPFSDQEIPLVIGNYSSPLIWGRGLNEWVAPDKWQKLVKDFEAIASQLKSQPERMWRLRMAGQETKPMTHHQMIELLKTKTDFSDILIWTEGYSEWKEIYQIHKVMDELGVSRRAHPRVPIMGSLTCEGAAGPFEAKILSISEGGLGVTHAAQVKIGEKFKIIIKSPNLFGPIHATAEVVYTGTDGYAGMKFVGIQSESKSAIIEYIKKFADLSPTQNINQ